MSESDTTTDTDPDRTAIRTSIRETIRAADTPPTRGDLTDLVATMTDADAAAVAAELDELERTGFVYLVGDGDGAEVNLP